jgi:hypothetical protein
MAIKTILASGSLYLSGAVCIIDHVTFASSK